MMMKRKLKKLNWKKNKKIKRIIPIEMAKTLNIDIVQTKKIKKD